jgi:predicted phosphodiesterase
MPDARDGELASAYEPCRAELVVYGHIHLPFVRSLDGLTVANSGSAGSPFDGDPRASYLLVDDRGPHVVRVAYDVEREASRLLASGYPDAARLAETRRLGAFVPPALL